MSHVVCSKVVITDLDILRRAVAKFAKLTWNEDKKTFAWYGEWLDDYKVEDAAYRNGIPAKDYGKCEFCIQVAGSQYEIGVVRRRDGEGWSIVWDNYNTHGRAIDRVIGKHGEKLMEIYAEEYISDYAIRNGYMLEQGTDSEGNIVLTLNAP